MIFVSYFCFFDSQNTVVYEKIHVLIKMGRVIFSNIKIIIQ